jgi:hypothetical protein
VKKILNIILKIKELIKILDENSLINLILDIHQNLQSSLVDIAYLAYKN